MGNNKTEQSQEPCQSSGAVCYAQASIPIEQWEGGIVDITIANGIPMKYMTQEKTVDQYGMSMMTFYFRSA